MSSVPCTKRRLLFSIYSRRIAILIFNPNSYLNPNPQLSQVRDSTNPMTGEPMPEASEAKTLDMFLNDPIAYFDSSITKMHQIPRDELEELQRQAMSRRFAEHRESIEMLRNLADRLEIKEVKEFNDVVPLFFAHTAFKSYPASLLDKKRFDLMTQWLNKLTSHDISHLDTEGCESIDEWIDRLDEQTPLEVITSSGTTGTLSLIPKDKHLARSTI